MPKLVSLVLGSSNGFFYFTYPDDVEPSPYVLDLEVVSKGGNGKKALGARSHSEMLSILEPTGSARLRVVLSVISACIRCAFSARNP